MKKVLFIAIAVCSIYCAHSQVITLPKGNMPKIPRSVIKTIPSVVVSRTTGNYPEVTMRVIVTVEDAGEQGYKVNFQSGIPLEKVEISRSEPVQIMNTYYFGGDKTSGYFFMDAPAYKGSNTYLLRFFAPGKEKGIWSAAIQRKAS